MKTIGARLALRYCLISTVTLFALLAVGYFLLDQHVVRSLNLLKAAELQTGAPIPEDLRSLDTSARQIMQGYAQTSLVLVCLALLASLIAGLVLSRYALRPVRLIQETANRIHSDNLGERIPVSGAPDEMTGLAQLLNGMFDRLESSFHQIRKFSAEASHELKTPLSLIRLQAEKLLIDGGLNPQQEEAVQMQLEEVAHLNHIIEDLLFLSRAEARAITMNFQRETPDAFLHAIATDASLLAEQAGVRFKEDFQLGEPVRFDPKRMRQVLLNLVSNALKFAPADSLLTVESGWSLDSWKLAVEDEGPGVPEGQRERIFERFVRLGTEKTDSPGGSGLGLAICRSIIDLHGGTICAEAGGRRGGLRVICEIPLRDAVTLSNTPGEPAPYFETDSLD